MARVTEVEYSRLANLGNYQHQRVSLRARLDENESAEDALRSLEDRARAYLGQPSRDAEALDALQARWEQWDQMLGALRERIARYGALRRPPLLYASDHEAAAEWTRMQRRLAFLQGRLAELDAEEQGREVQRMRRELGRPRTAAPPAWPELPPPPAGIETDPAEPEDEDDIPF